MSAIRLLLNSALDYAGLFPPANLGMTDCVRNYAAYACGEYSWALGRLIIPSGRVGEFEEAVAELRVPRRGGQSWRLSLLGGADAGADVERIRKFNRRHARDAGAAAAVVEAVEWKARSADEIENGMGIYSGMPETYCEIPLSEDARNLLSVAARMGARAKVRTGGLMQESFPSPAQLARFILLCAQARVPFKATAGLHHALRSTYLLTYEPSSPAGVMHGFLNVLLAVAFAHVGSEAKEIESILSEESIAVFEFGENGVSWRGRRLASQNLSSMREHLFVGFGTCSFQEPISELKALNLL